MTFSSEPTSAERQLRLASALSRFIGAIAALALLGSLLLPWFYDRTVVPNQPLDAWEAYLVRDLFFAGLGLVAFVAALPVVPRRPSVAARLATATLVCLAVVHSFMTASLGVGAWLALLAATLVGLAAAVELLPARWIAFLPAPGLGALDRWVGHLVPQTRWPQVHGWQVGDLSERAARARPFLRLVWRLVTSSPVLGFVVWLWAQSTPSLALGGGIDGSWITALHVGAQQGLNWGTEVIYTYGPLGYLTVPRLGYPDLAVQSYLFAASAYYGLAVTALWAARRSLPLPVAFLVALVVLESFRIVSPDEQTQFAIVAMSFAWAVGLVESEALRSSRWLPLLMVPAGAVAALEVLVKLNSGVTIFLLLGIAALTLGPWRRPVGLVAFLAGFVAALLGLWAAAGQPLANLGDYARTSLEVVAGFSGSMYREEEGMQWEYLAAAALIVMIALAAWNLACGWPARRRAALLILTALVTLSAFKQGFVRHDEYHARAFFATALLVLVTLGWRGRRWTPAFFAVGAAAIAFVGVAQPQIYELHSPEATKHKLRENRQALNEPAAFIEQTRAELRTGEAVPPRLLQLIGRRPVHFHPTEAALAWAYPELNWRPLPTLQNYLGYTETLDEKNAEMLRSGRAPQRILRSTENAPFESPRATLEMFCRYREIDTAGDWQVLARVPSRCGQPRRVTRVETRTEQPIRVPKVEADEVLFFRVRGWEPDLGERLRSLLWKPYSRGVVLGGDESQIATGMGESPNLLGVGRSADYSGDFRMDRHVDAITFRVATNGVLGPPQPLDRPVTVSFYKLSVERPGLAAEAKEKP